MFLDAVSGTVTQPSNGFSEHNSVSECYYKWAHWEPTVISHHARECCEMVRQWICAIDLSCLNGGHPLTGPRWLRHRYEWGPTCHPVFWCDIGEKTVLDCGLHASLAHEVFLDRGVASFRAQFVQEYAGEAPLQWRQRWEKGEAVTEWIDDSLIYHEGCAVAPAPGHLKLWDPSAGWWLNPNTTSGYGSLRAVRIFSDVESGEFEWGQHTIILNKWITLP